MGRALTRLVPGQAPALHGAAVGKEVGPNVLFFGCRDPAHDFLYEEELKGYVASGDLELYTAFSRTQVRPLGRAARSAQTMRKVRAHCGAAAVPAARDIMGCRRRRCTSSTASSKTSSASTTCCRPVPFSTSAGTSTTG